MRVLVLVIIAVAVGAVFGYLASAPTPLKAGEVVPGKMLPGEPVDLNSHGADEQLPAAPGAMPDGRPDIGFAGSVLHPKYVQPYYNFARPSSIPLDRSFSDFVDPIGRMDTSFENDKEVRIGFLGCLSGPAKAYSGEMLNGAMMAVLEINAAGGYHGKPVVLIQRDDKANMGENANQMV